MKKTTLAPDIITKLLARLDRGSTTRAGIMPGASEKRQPVHTVYGGAHLFRADTAARLGAIAVRTLQEFAPDARAFAAAAGFPENRVQMIYARVIEKLRREPVEDYRLDFEDGYGIRPDSEEDGHAEAAAAELAAGGAAGQLPPYTGIRIKPLNRALRRRSVRTLEIFLTTLAKKTSGRLVPNFAVTLPKITSPAQLAALAELLSKLERKLHVAAGATAIELMIETPESIINERGVCALPEFVAAADGRCRGAHFGPYDYTAACGITAAHQTITHPACDFARSVMRVALAGSGVWLSDGPTNILPLPIHRPAKDGPPLTVEQSLQNREAVYRAWKLHVEHIRHSLMNGFYQGWDLHPAQLPTRFAAVYDFFLAGLDSASERLRNFIQKAARATVSGEMFDDAATGQGLLNYFLRAMRAGAITEQEAREHSGLTIEELRAASFLKILEKRNK